MNWPPENTILSSVLKGNWDQAGQRATNYVKSGEILSDAVNTGRILISGGTDVGAWANAGAKAVGGYNGAGDLTGGYGAYLNAGASAFDLANGGAKKTADLMKSQLGKTLMKNVDTATKLAGAAGGIISLAQSTPRTAAAAQNVAQSQSALMSGSIGAPPAMAIPYSPSAGGSAIDPVNFEAKTSIPAWLIIGGVAYLLFFRK